MSKAIARGAQSYENEELLLAMLPELLEQKGFTGVTTVREGVMKFVKALACDGSAVKFWLKQGWTNTRDYSAIQFGMFKTPDFEYIPDSEFIDYVATRVASAKRRGATHALLVHMVDSCIRNYVALEIDQIAEAYRQQIGQWPKRARNSKTPTLYFEDGRSLPDASCVSVVLNLEITLASVCGLPDEYPNVSGSKKITAEIELRMRQQLFRLAVGKRFNWRCAISGTNVKAVLDAAHLPGRDWRRHNAAEDGVLLRADLHRLLDRDLAQIRDGTFWLEESVRVGEYAQFHGRPIG